MSLRDRLRSMNAAGTAAKPKAVPDRPASPPPPTDDALAQIPGARVLNTPYGDVVCIEHHYPLETARGCILLETAKRAPQLGWERLLRGSAPSGGFSIHDTVFIDTETTGLERGAGTYAFLVGIGRIRGQVFSIRQFLMRDYHEEPALMHALVDELRDATGLITYNGKSFDWPLLQTRAVLNRVALPSLHHIDLVHPARRLWSTVTENCRLTQLELEILGVERVGDVPGALIPYIYFQYLQTGDTGPLHPVIEHNRLDLLTTLALSGYMAEAAAHPTRARPTGAELPASDLYAFGRLFATDGETLLAIECLEESRRRGLPQHMAGPCAGLLGNLYKRVGHFDRAVPLWHDMVAQDALAPVPHIELAKYYEHQEKNFLLAKEWTLKAIDWVRQRRLLRGLGRSAEDGTTRRLLADLQHRLDRLENKIARSQSRHSDPSHPA